jgi:hypothetical protein
VEEINIRTLKVLLSPIGNSSFVSNLAEKKFYKPILHAQNMSLSNKKHVDSHADMASVRSSSGLPRGGAPVASAVELSADSRHLHNTRSCEDAADSVGQQHGQPEEPAIAVAASVGPPAVQEPQRAAARTVAGPLMANDE